MFTKLLLTLGVILVVVMVVRGQSRPDRGPATSAHPTNSRPRSSTARTTAWTLVGIFVALTLAYTAWQWLGTREVVTVRVVNTDNGSGVTYRAYRGEVGQYSFTTIDGRSITLAKIERMEVTQPRQ